MRSRDGMRGNGRCLKSGRVLTQNYSLSMRSRDGMRGNGRCLKSGRVLTQNYSLSLFKTPIVHCSIDNIPGKAVSVQMSQIRMSQVDEEQKGPKKKAPPLSNGGSVTNVRKQNGDRSRSRSENRKGNKKGAEMEDDYVGRLTCKICQCVFCDDDDKLIECGRCEKWECINCSNMSEKQYDLLNDKAWESDCIGFAMNAMRYLAISAVKTDKEIEENCRQYFHTVREEIQETRTVLDKRITSEVSGLREDINKLKKDLTKNSDPKLASKK